MGQASITVKLHKKVLNRAQQGVLRQLGAFATERQFCLAGGTAVALQLGHRKSVDLDWFTASVLDQPARLAGELKNAGMAFEFAAELRGALHGTIDGVRVSFIEYPYRTLSPQLKVNSYEMASLDDLAAIKLSAILQRGARKDFVDVFALGLKHASLEKMLDLYQQKFNTKDMRQVLHALTYTVDAEKEPMPKMLWKQEWPEIVRTIRKWILMWEGTHR